MIERRIEGHWQRNWLRAKGSEDSTTRVHWIQAGRWCADIRVPLDRPDPVSGGTLSALSGADLAVLLGAEGFAGHTTFSGDACTWHRTWNWRGFPCPVDAGTLGFDDAGNLIEDGLHADYREEWRRVSGPGWRAFAIETDGADGMLLSNDAGFVLGLGQRGAPAGTLLAQALREGTASSAEAEPAFASVYVKGHWQGRQGVADLSTQPFCEGRIAIERTTDAMTLSLPDFHGGRVSRRLALTPLDPA